MNIGHTPKKANSQKTVSLLQGGRLVISLLLMIAPLLYYYWAREKDIFIQLVLFLIFYTALINLLSLYTRYKSVRVFYHILSIPGIILLVTGRPVQIIGSILFTYLIIVGITIIGVVYSQDLFKYQLQFSAGVYLVLTISSIAATTRSEWLIKSWHNAQNRNYKESVEHYSLFIFSHEKVRYVIFVGYFLLIILFTLTSLNNMPLIGQKDVDIAILQSFATYVAFDRLVSNWATFLKSKKQQGLQTINEHHMCSSH